MPDRVGQQLGNYRLLRMLGRGAFAAVYLGDHRYLDRPAAIKVLHVQIEPLRYDSFRHEARTIAQLQHPHIIGVHDFGIEDQMPYLVMEYMPNGTLRSRHPKGTRLSLEQVIIYVKQIASALDYAHERRVIHRDIKPENILLNSNHEVVISDFGIAMVQHTLDSHPTQNQAGTPQYMAPEQIQREPCAASDQYALGVMVYEWLCGEPPFHGSLFEVLSQHLYKAPPSLCARVPELPPAVENVVMRTLAKDPQQRFACVADFASALEHALFATQPLLPDGLVEHGGQQQSEHPFAHLKIVPILSSREQKRIDPTTQPQSKTKEHVGEKREPVASVSPQARYSLAQANRQRLLRRVRSFWIAGVLEQSLYRAVLISLGLQAQPDAVANPWRLVIQELEHTALPLPTGTRITKVYDDSDCDLLILGEPGAGKTTLLLELARDLLNRADQKLDHPIPVVFNLSSWTRKRQALATWLIEEMETKYQVPRKVGSDWVNADQILPLLDGLDEVDPAYRSACMQAINEYHQAHALVPLVVCSRTNEYMSQAKRLALYRAVSIQPLTSEQVNEYLVRIGEQVASLRVAFQNDPVLQELATTPLMLTILIMAYQGSSLEEIEGGVSAEVRREQIFATYTQRMLRRRSTRSRYSPQQTIHWLGYLAQQMKQQSQTVFYVERMQPTWLLKRWQRQLYHGLLVGSISGLLIGLDIIGILLPFPLTVLLTALIVGSLFGWLSEPGAENEGAKTSKRPRIRIRRSLATALESRLVIGVVASLSVGIGSALYLYLIDYADWSFGARIAGAFSYGTFYGLYMGLPIGLAIRIARRIEPMETLSWSWAGMRRNIVKWLLLGIVTGTVLGLIGTLPYIVSIQGLLWLANFLPYGLAAVFNLVLVLMLVNGVTRGLSKRALDARYIVTPNQGIWRSARYGIVVVIIIGVIAAIFNGVSYFIFHFWLLQHMGITTFKTPLITDYAIVDMMSHLLNFSPTTWQDFWALRALFEGLIDGAIPGLAAGLYCGGAAYLQHFVLRILLCFARALPFNYPRFLDYANERILLRKVGGGYIFIHRLLLDYFAALEEKRDLN